jgi:asparagine N-glycosylation enzyme membrane subunit Stt3
MSITSATAATATTPSASSSEIASVLLVTQASLSLVAGLSAIPFGIVEPGFRVLSAITILVAIAMFWLARNLRRQRPWARRWVISLEALSLVASLLLTVLPIGAMRGPVPVLVNLVMPAAVLWLLWSRSGRAAFKKAGRSDARGAA